MVKRYFCFVFGYFIVPYFFISTTNQINNSMKKKMFTVKEIYLKKLVLTEL